jgi:hypothetical protein
MDHIRLPAHIRKNLNRLGELYVGLDAAEGIAHPHKIGSTYIEIVNIMSNIRKELPFEKRIQMALDA